MAKMTEQQVFFYYLPLTSEQCQQLNAAYTTILSQKQREIITSYLTSLEYGPDRQFLAIVVPEVNPNFLFFKTSTISLLRDRTFHLLPYSLYHPLSAYQSIYSLLPPFTLFQPSISDLKKQYHHAYQPMYYQSTHCCSYQFA